MGSHNDGGAVLRGRRILLVDDEADTLDACTQILRKDGYQVETAVSAREAIQLQRSRPFDLTITDLKMPQVDGLELLKAIKRVDPEMAVVMITGYAPVETAVASMKEGAYDYIPKPFTPDELRLVVRNALERQELVGENTDLRERLSGGRDQLLVGGSGAMQRVHQLIARVAETDSTVLILGETGTGKELVARAIHTGSLRASAALITVNCAAIPSDLLESELFGHERGAFTGAIRRKRGSFELAHRGSLFLDEVGALSPALQAKLLRALQEGEVRPVGSEHGIRLDVRIIAATNRDLAEATRQGAFRDDLFYRLNVVPIHVPPLRERKEDIPPLADHFIAQFRRKLPTPVRGMAPAALDLLVSYDWPGNVRELEHAIERAIILAEGEVLDWESFAHLLPSPAGVPGARAGSTRTRRPVTDARDFTDLPSLEKVERDYIMEVLQATRWNRKRASEILGISTVTLWRKVQGERPES
ncbi:MAG: sigma-54-dependent Fis family transcriptional regulator [candidate division NC10 bacterium]|nr:sigma-54-dependent Fis family transcriptional regulator [candidate division NC10 bacterium]